MKLYDFNKAKQLIEANRDNLSEASLGMHEDWFWTADTIFEDNEFVKELNDNTEIGGINGSRWATPTLQLKFKDDTDKMIPCYTGESCGEPNTNFLGVLSSPVQQNITPLSGE